MERASLSSLDFDLSIYCKRLPKCSMLFEFEFDFGQLISCAHKTPLYRLDTTKQSHYMAASIFLLFVLCVCMYVCVCFFSFHFISIYLISICVFICRHRNECWTHGCFAECTHSEYVVQIPPNYSFLLLLRIDSKSCPAFSIEFCVLVLFLVALQARVEFLLMLRDLNSIGSVFSCSVVCSGCNICLSKLSGLRLVSHFKNLLNTRSRFRRK